MPNTTAPSASRWQDLLDQINTSGNFFRPKEGSTRIRLIPLPGMEPDADGAFQFWEEVQTNFRGQIRTKFVIAGLILEAKGARPEMATSVTPIVISKSVLKGILGLLAEGYELFDLTEGYGITLKRSGQGLDTDYAVMPSKNPVVVKEEDIEIPQKTLAELAEDFEKWANRPSGQGNSSEDEGSEEEEEPPARRPSNSRRRGGSQDW